MPLFKNIIFDLGEVLLPLKFHRMHEELEALGVADSKAVMSHGVTSKVFRDFEIGRASTADVTGHVRALSPHAPQDEAIHAAINAMLLDFPRERIDLLHRLKSKYRLFLFSNTNAIHYDCFQERYQQQFSGRLDDHFEKAYYSHLIGLRKPDLAAFQHVINDAGIIARETVFIDDVAENAQGATAAGLHGVHLTPGKTILDLDL